MNDKDQSSAAAFRPHRDSSDTATDATASLWERLKARFGLKPATLRDDLNAALAEAGNGGEAFSDGERSLIRNVLNLGQVRIEDVMVPRADIEAVEIDRTVADLIDRFRAVEHSRLPVYDDTLDRIIGMVHIKDLLAALAENTPPSSKSGLPVRLRSALLKSTIERTEIVRRVMYVPPSMPAGDLLQSMQATRIHMAIVVDEYGGTDGLVTIEDLLEAVVGDIEDEHDEEEDELIRQAGDGVWIADARIELDELAEAIGPDFDPGSHGEEVDTLGGLLFTFCGQVPVRGEVVRRLRGFEFEVLQADPRRIRRVQITRRRRAGRARPVGGEHASAPTGKAAAE